MSDARRLSTTSDRDHAERLSRRADAAWLSRMSDRIGSPELRAVAAMRHGEGLQYDAIAERLGVPPWRACRLMARADRVINSREFRLMVEHGDSMDDEMRAVGQALFIDIEPERQTARLLGISHAVVRKAKAGIVAIAAATYPSIKVSIGRGFRVRKTPQGVEVLP